jgi:pimeloyl-ACP methyl ester carboxylesterase
MFYSRLVTSTLTVMAVTTTSILNGQRCQLISATYPSLSPPLVIMPGFAQSIEVYQGHSQRLAALLPDRDILVYECRGMGPMYRADNSNDNNECTSSSLGPCSLPRQAQLLQSVLATAFDPIPDYVDLVGFSLGGRIALALATLQDSSHLTISNNHDTNGGHDRNIHLPLPAVPRIRKLHLSGVGAYRDSAGLEVLQNWYDLLQDGNLPAFAESALSISCSAAFLQRHDRQLPQWRQNMVQSHTLSGLKQVIRLMRVIGPFRPWPSVLLCLQCTCAVVPRMSYRL